MQVLLPGCWAQHFAEIVAQEMQVMRRDVLALLAALLIFPLLASAADPPNNPPNVVLITIDTVRADHVGCYGYKLIETPHLDALAAAGVRFTNAYTPVPITLSAHSVMLTGTYPMRTGMHDFSGNRLNASQPTLATLLHGKGYTTGAVLGSAVLDSRFGLNRGFDFYYDHFDFSRLDEKNIDAMMRPGNEVIDRALGWLEGNRRKPFLLWVHLYDAHHPYNSPSPYLQKYRARPYDGGIAFVDAQVGRVVSYLKAKGLYDRTLIVVAADHGEGLGEHGEKTHGFFIYDTTLHVPLIFKLPSGTGSQKSVVADAANLADILPTVLEIIGASSLKEVQGRSLVSSIAGKPTTTEAENYAETYLPRIHFNWSELRGVRFRQYHFIDAPRPELYDLTADPHELKNLYSTKRAVASVMRMRLGQLVTQFTPAAGEKTAEKTEKDSLPVHYLLALNYYRQSDFSAAIKEFQIALRLSPDYSLANYYLGLSYAQTGDWDQAIASFRRTLELDATNFSAAYNLGAAYLKQGKVEDAEGTFRRSVNINPGYAQGHEALGELLLYKGKLDEAIATLRTALEVAPGYAKAREVLVKALQANGQNREAEEVLRKKGAGGSSRP